MITSTITFTFRKEYIKTPFCFLNDIQFSFEKRAQMYVFFPPERSDLKSETTMMKNQMPWMDPFCFLVVSLKGMGIQKSLKAILFCYICLILLKGEKLD